jgi:putative tricarboxylic transport membrane protein
VLGFVLNRIGYPTVPILLGLVLGPIAESNFRRALLISRGDPLIFVGSVVSIVLIFLCIVSLIFGYRLTSSLNRQVRKAGIDPDSD